MMMPDQSQSSKRAFSSLPLFLAVAAGLVQISSLFQGVHVLTGMALSIGAVACGHVVLSRINRYHLPGRARARTGLVLAYLSLLLVPALESLLESAMVGGH